MRVDSHWTVLTLSSRSAHGSALDMLPAHWIIKCDHYDHPMEMQHFLSWPWAEREHCPVWTRPKRVTDKCAKFGKYSLGNFWVIGQNIEPSVSPGQWRHFSQSLGGGQKNFDPPPSSNHFSHLISATFFHFNSFFLMFSLSWGANGQFWILRGEGQCLPPAPPHPKWRHCTWNLETNVSILIGVPQGKQRQIF